MRCMLAVLVVYVLPLAGQDSPVTATQVVRVGRDQKETLRKINGRWWTQDNREVQPPKQTGMFGFWVVDSKPGVCTFYHHRPFDLRRAESLRLFLKQSEVQSLLGPPNRTFSGFWYYYAPDGTKLTVRFMEGELGEADYEKSMQKRPVQPVAAELAGRNIYSVMAARASRRAPPAGGRGRQPQASFVEPAHGPVQPVVKRVVEADALESIQPGMPKQDVLRRLGEPSARTAITTDDGVRENLTYHRPDGSEVSIRMVDGKVTDVR